MEVELTEDENKFEELEEFAFSTTDEDFIEEVFV